MANDQLKVLVGPDSCLRCRVTIKLIAMKFFVSTSFALLVLLATSCKKEKTAKANKIGGEYVMYEMESRTPPYEKEAVPDASGNGGSIILTLKNDSTTEVVLVLYDKNKKELGRENFGTAKIVKDQDGDIILVDNAGNLAYIWEDYDMDFYGYDEYRIGAKKK